MGGVDSGGVSSAIYNGTEQCASRFPLQAQSDLRVGMDSEDRGLSGSAQEMASFHRSFRHLVKSPMLPIFFSVPRSECSAPELEWVAGVCLYSLVSDSSCYKEAPFILWGPPGHHSSVLASKTVVSGACGGRSGSSSIVTRPSTATSLPSSSSGGVRAVSSCVETIQQFARSQGFSSHVAKQASLAHRSSSRAGYQAKWSVYRQWCRSEGHSVSRPSLPKVADFLFWLHRSRKLSVSAVLGYRSMLSAVFRFQLPEISSSSVIQDLLHSFKVEAPCRSVRPPSWDLEAFLRFLRSPVFEPISSCCLRDLTQKTLFLVALATAKRVGEIQALSRVVSFSSSSAGLSYVPEFLAKTVSAVRPLPRSFSVQSLQHFAAGLQEELLLCPVCSLREYLRRTSLFVNRPRRLFVSPLCPSRAVSKNGISFLLREVIVQSGASSESGAAPRAHCIRGMATSSAFFKNRSVSSVLEEASWKSNMVFTSFYFRDLQYVFEVVRSLGPFVAAGECIR